MSKELEGLYCKIRQKRAISECYGVCVMSNTDIFHIWDFNGAGNPRGKSKGKLNLRFSGSQLDLKLRPQFSAGV